MISIRGGERLKEFLSKLEIQKGNVDVGFFEGAHYPDKDISVVQVAIYNEYGDPKQKRPPRPFMKQTFDNYSKYWRDTFAKLVVKYDYNSEKSLNTMGAIIQGQIQETIDTGDFAPNALVTRLKKGEEKPPLEDTLLMHRSVTYNVTT